MVVLLYVRSLAVAFCSSSANMSLEAIYLAALESGFPDVGSSYGCALFRLPSREGGFQRCNELALEMNHKALLPWCGKLRPTSYKALVNAFCAFDKNHSHRLSGMQSRRSKLDWSRDEADKLVMLNTHMRSLFVGSRSSRSGRI